MNASEDLLEQLLAVSQDQLRWQRAAVLPRVRETIDRTLATGKQRRAYQLLDGTRESKAVCQALEVPKGTLSGWTTKWRNVGIAFNNEEGHVQHLISLDALDLDLDPQD